MQIIHLYERFNLVSNLSFRKKMSCIKSTNIENISLLSCLKLGLSLPPSLPSFPGYLTLLCVIKFQATILVSYLNNLHFFKNKEIIGFLNVCLKCIYQTVLVQTAEVYKDAGFVTFFAFSLSMKLKHDVKYKCKLQNKRNMMSFLFFCRSYIRRKHRNRENFQLPVFNGFIIFGMC